MNTDLMLTGVILLVGFAIFIIGNAVTFYTDLTDRMWQEPLEELNKSPAGWRWAHTSFLIGNIVTMVGLSLLCIFLYEAGSSLLAPAGLLLVVVGTSLSAVYISFRNTVTVSAAETLKDSGEAPKWYDSLAVWTYWLGGVFIVLSYFALSLIGAAILETEFLASWIGWLLAILGLVLAFIFLTRIPRGPWSGDESIAHLPHWIYLMTLILGIVLVVAA